VRLLLLNAGNICSNLMDTLAFILSMCQPYLLSAKFGESDASIPQKVLHMTQMFKKKLRASQKHPCTQNRSENLYLYFALTILLYVITNSVLSSMNPVKICCESACFRDRFYGVEMPHFM
jgi:hypothetical protein